MGEPEADKLWEKPVSRLPLSRLTLLVFVLLALLSVGGSLGVRQIVAHQKHTFLNERAKELALVLTQSTVNIASELPAIGAVESVAVSTPKVFDTLAAPLEQSKRNSVAIAKVSGRQIVILAQAGSPLRVDSIDTPIGGVIVKATTASGMITAITNSGKGRILTFAQDVNGIVVLVVSPLMTTVEATPRTSSPFSDVRLALYASKAPSPSSLVLRSRTLPDGHVANESFPVGTSRWLVVVSARTPLVGSIAATAPWIALLVGLSGSVLAGTVIEILVRRRRYALALVEERTASLAAVLVEKNELQQAETRAREEAETANRSKNEFLSRMSHELRTPLNAVIGFAQVLRRHELDEDQQHSVDHILKGGQYLLGLINEVLDISRAETGDLALSPEPVRLDELVGDAISLIRPLADQRSIHLIRAQDSNCHSYVLADRHRLEQVLINLLSNAVKYNHHGGSVTVSCEPTCATRIRIVVEDTGSGIPQELISRLFVPFDRLGAERSETEGTGIGLSLSRKLAEAMGGSLGLESTVGAGSKFWVELAVVEGPVERYERLNYTSSSETARVVTEGNRRKILYVEDNLANLTLVQRIMTEREGLELISSMQGRLGIELAREHLPALVLLDLHLPDITGDEVLQRLRENPATASIPVVIVSADATSGQIKKLLNAGAVAYLTKPIDVDELLGIVDEYVTAATSP